MVALVNTGSKPHNITLEFTKLGWPASASASVRDLWENNHTANSTGDQAYRTRSAPVAAGRVTERVESHGTAVLWLELLPPP